MKRASLGYYISPSLVVYNLTNGTIAVYSNGKVTVTVKINDSDALIPTPARMAAATHVFTVPSGSMISSKGM